MILVLHDVQHVLLFLFGKTQHHTWFLDQGLSTIGFQLCQEFQLMKRGQIHEPSRRIPGQAGPPKEERLN